MWGFEIASHSNLIIGNLLLFFVGIYGVGICSSWAGLFGFGYGVLAVVPVAFVIFNSIVGIVGLLKKKKNCIVFFKYSVGFWILGSLVVGILKLTAMSKEAKETVMNTWSEDEVDTVALFLFNTKEHCPGKYRCRDALASYIYIQMRLAGLFDIMIFMLYLIPFTGIVHIMKENTSTAAELEKQMEAHHSQININAKRKRSGTREGR